MDFMKSPSVIVAHLAGSRAYGTQTAASDTDIRGIFVTPQKVYRTPFFNGVTELTIPDEEDTKLFELRNFMLLCSRGSPNVIETLWVDKSDVLKSSPEYELLRKHRDLFSSKMMIDSLVRFARGSVYQIKNYKEAESMVEPKQIHFMSLVTSLKDPLLNKKNFDIGQFANGYLFAHFGNRIYGAYRAPDVSGFSPDMSIKKIPLGHPAITGKEPEFIFKFNQEDYERKRDVWKGVQQRAIEGSTARQVMKDKFGYDTKDGMHIVRLLRMTEEFAETGQLIVKRPDAEELKAVREQGTYSIQELSDYAEQVSERMNARLPTLNLPDEPDYERLADLTIRLQDMNQKRVILSELSHQTDKAPR